MLAPFVVLEPGSPTWSRQPRPHGHMATRSHRHTVRPLGRRATRAVGPSGDHPLDEHRDSPGLVGSAPRHSAAVEQYRPAMCGPNPGFGHRRAHAKRATRSGRSLSLVCSMLGLVGPVSVGARSALIPHGETTAAVAIDGGLADRHGAAGGHDGLHGIHLVVHAGVEPHPIRGGLVDQAGDHV